MSNIRLVILTGASSLMMATAAMAQTAPAAQTQPDPQGAESAAPMADAIVVTARRRDEALQDVPQTVNVVTGDALQKLNLNRFEDVTQVVPGLQLSQQGGYSFSTALRGVSFDSAGGAAPNVEFYINDASVSPFSLFQSLYDIGQIEVLRGPQGTLRGRASPSGSITVTTHKPDLDQVSGTMQASGSDLGTINVQGGVGVPIITDVLAIRFAGTVDHNDSDRVKVLAPSPGPYSRTTSGRASIRFEPSSSLDVNIMYQYLKRKARNYLQVESTALSQPNATPQFGDNTLIRGRDRLAISDTPSLVDEKQHLVTGTVNFRFGGQQLSYVGSYFDLRQNTTQPQDAGGLFPGQDITQRTATHGTQQTHELRLSSQDPLFGFLDYTVGGFYADTTGDNVLAQPQPVGINVGVPLFLFQYDLPLVAATPKTEKSLFGNLVARFGGTEISGGLRYIEIKDDVSVALDLAGLGGTGFLDIQPSNPRKFSKTIYNFSIKQELTPDLMIYANTGSSFRTNAPAVGIGRPLTQGLAQFVNLAPETSKSYEAGLKASLLDRKLDVSLAVFHQDFKGFLYRDSQFVTFVDLVNPGGSQTDPANFVANEFNFLANVPAKVDGVEAQVTYRPFQGFYIDGQFAYAKGKIKNGTIACNDANGDGIPDGGGVPPTPTQIFNGSGGNAVSSCQISQRLSSQPNWSINVQSEYAVPVLPDADVFVRGLFQYRPNNSNVPTNPYDTVKAYGLLNLYAGLRSADGAWEVTAFAKNLTNTYRTLSRSDTPATAFTSAFPAQNIPAASFSSNYVRVSSTPPREFGLSVRYAFGGR